MSMRYGSFAPYRPMLVSRSPRGDCCYFSGRCFWFNEAFFFFTAGMRSSRESELPALATEVSSAPALVGSDLVPVSFLATFRPSDTFRCGWWHYSVVCVCVCLCVIAVCCSVSADPLSMSPQKALETIGANLQKQYENWQPRVSEFMFASPSLFCCTVLLRHTDTRAPSTIGASYTRSLIK